jgi:hypothetical protein
MDSPPLIPGDWRRIAAPDAGQLVGRFQMALIELLPPGVHPEKVNMLPKAVRAMPLRCYAQTLLCEVETVRDLEALSTAAFLFGPFGIRIINGSSAMLHDLNEAVGVVLDTPDQAAAYCRFFCSAVHGDLGRFEAIEAEDQLGMVALSDDTRNRIGPIRAVAEGDKWQLATVVRYDNALFWCEFRLDRDGLIVMTTNDPLDLIELPVAESFDFPFRRLPLPDKGTPE